MKLHGNKFKTREKSIDWNKKIQDFEFQVKRSIKILKNFKSKEQLEQVLSINQKISNIIPSGAILKDFKLVDKFLRIANSIKENYFFIEAKELGRHLINSLMYLHGVAQTYYATQWYYYFIYLVNKKIYNNIEQIEVRRLNRLLGNFDFILLSAIEYLLYKYKDFFIEEVEPVEKINDICYRIIKFIKEYTTYFNEIHTLNFFKLNNVKELDLLFGPGMYYFRVEIDQPEILDYGKQKFDVSFLDSGNYMEESEHIFKNLEHDFLKLNEIWLEKFGYRIESIISTAKILLNEINDKYSTFWEPYNSIIPVFEIPDLKDKDIKFIGKIFDKYLSKLISNYLEKQELYYTFWKLEDLTNTIKEHRSDWKPNELPSVLKELRVDQSTEFNLGVNNLANHLYYFLNDYSLFFYIIGYSGALRERLYIQTSKLDHPHKEFILIDHIKRILKNYNFKIHPLSGKQIIGKKKRTLGEIDVIATLNNDILLFIESKIIPQKKIDLSKIRNFNQHQFQRKLKSKSY